MMFQWGRESTVKELMSQPETARMSDIELGKLLGQRKAFGLVAGRCSAEQAAALKEIRDRRGFVSIAPTWDEFCTKELRMSRVHANRIIKWFEEFGQAYFEMAQLTRISPDEYRALAPEIVDHRLLLDGVAVALIPEKAEDVAAAVAKLRKTSAAKKPGASMRDRLTSLEKQCDKLTAEFEDLSGETPRDERVELAAILVKHISVLGRIEQAL
jgi:hypothetical protein